MATLLAIGLVAGSSVGASADDSYTAEFTAFSKTVSSSSVTAGDSVTWTITVSCSSLTSICIDSAVADAIPPEFSVTAADITVTGNEKPATVTVEGQNVSVAFNETSTVAPGEKGLWDGQTAQIAISTTLRGDLSPDRDGESVVNETSVTGSNAAPRTTSAPVTILVPPKYQAQASKDWSDDTVIRDSGDQNTASISFSNASNVPVSELVLTEPSAGSDDGAETPAGTIFDDFPITALSLTEFPEGATQASVEVRTSAGWQDPVTIASASLPAGSTALLPAGIALDDVLGIKMTFTGSGASIVANGASGGLSVTVAQKAGTSPASIVDNVVGTSVSQGSNQNFVTANDSFTLGDQALSVTGSKTYAPSSVWSGEQSTVTINGTNSSNTGVDSLVVTEPAPGIEGFAGLNQTFDGFGTVVWPAGAQTATVAYSYSDGTSDSQSVDVAEEGTTLPTADTATHGVVTGFTVTFTAATGARIQPGDGFSLPFEVTAGTATGISATFTNRAELTADRTGLTPGTTVVPGDLTIRNPTLVTTADKVFSPESAPAVKGQAVNTKISGGIDSSTNVPVSEFVLEDSVDTQSATLVNTLWGTAFEPTQLSTGVVPNGVTATVQYATGAAGSLTWTTLGTPYTGTLGQLDLPANATGIRIVYTPTSPSGNLATLITANAANAVLVFTATDEVQVQSYANRATSTGTSTTPETLTGTSDASRNVSMTAPGTGGQSSSIDVYPWKAWFPSDWYAYPAGTPAQTGSFQIAARNDSITTVDSLQMVDQAGDGETDGYADAFKYVDITGITVQLPAAPSTVSSLSFTATNLDGTTAFTVSGADVASVRTQIQALSADQLSDVVKIEARAGGVIQPGTELKLIVSATLRDTVRGTTIPITTASEFIGENNTVTVTATKAGQPDATDAASSAINIRPLSSQALSTNVSKTISANTSAVYQQVKPTQTVTIRQTELTGNPWRTVLEDSDLRFWNAFTFTGVTAPTSLGTVVDNSGNAVSGQSPHYQYAYRTGGTWSLDGSGAPVLTGASWTVADVDSTNLPTGVTVEQVNGVRLTIFAGDSPETAPVPYWSIQGSGKTFSFMVTPTETLKTGGAVPTATPLPGATGDAGFTNNTATIQVVNAAGTIRDASSTADYRFTAGNTDIDIAKNPSNVTATPGTIINYRLTATTAGSMPVTNPQFIDTIDTIPAGEPNAGQTRLIFEPGGQTAEYSYEITETDGSTTSVVETGGHDQLSATLAGNTITFTFVDPSKVLRQNQTIVITVPMMVRFGTSPNSTFQNHFKLVADGGIDTNTVNADVTVISGPSYWITKDVREVPAVGDTLLGSTNVVDPATSCTSDSGFYKYPCIVQTRPGGTSEWRLRITNTGNIGSETATAYDVFPHDGDRGVLLSQARGSQWSPSFNGSITLAEPQSGYVEPAGAVSYTVYYQTAADPSCVLSTSASGQSLQDPASVTCPDSAWHLGFGPAVQGVGDTMTLSYADGVTAADVTAIKVVMQFDTAAKFAPGDQVQLRYTTTNPTTIPDTVDPSATQAPAWNSFAIHLTADGAPSADQRYQVIEPVKAGIAYSLPTPSFAVGDRVWVDVNRNGIQDPGEFNLAGVTVTLYNTAGTVVATTTTNADGRYLFDGLFAGDYTIGFELTDAQKLLYQFTATGKGTSSSDSDPDSSGMTPVFTLATDSTSVIPGGNYNTGEQVIATTSDLVDPTLDAGVYPFSVSVGDTVWKDLNRNGVQDSGEPGIPGVWLSLSDGDGNPVLGVDGTVVGDVKTDSNGRYLFTGLPPLPESQHYTVTLNYTKSRAALQGLVPTTALAGSNRALDSSTGSAESWLDLSSDGSSDLTLDFGFVEVEPLISGGLDGSLINTGRDGTFFLALLLGGLGLIGAGAAAVSARVASRREPAQ